MKKLKIVFAAALAALTVGAVQLNAQDKPATLGVRAGANLSSFGGDPKDAKYTFKYRVGITADIALGDNLYLLTGLDLQTKGAKFKGAESAKLKYNPMYLQLPATIGYKLEIGADTRLVFNVGPYIALGLGGKSNGGGEESEKLFKDKVLKRLDYGATGGVGIEFGMLSVSAGYDLGLGNVSDVKGFKVNNRNAYLIVGVKF